MLAIVLQILKILGIIILVLLSVLVALILIFLFVPVRYQAKGYYNETYEVRAKVTWLLHLVSAQVSYSKEQALLVVVRIFGICVFHSQKNAEKKLQKEKDEQSDVETELSSENMEKQEVTQMTTTKIQPHTRPRQEDIPIQETQNQEKDVLENKDLKKCNLNQKVIEEPEVSFWKKIRTVIEKFVQQIVDIKYTIREIYGKINKVKENITYYTQILQEDSTKEAILVAKKQLLRILKNVKPKVFLVHVHLGMEDSPDILGKILGVWGMLYPIHKGSIEMKAEFEQTVLEGDFQIKGRITLYVYLWTVYLYLFDKNIKRVKKSLLREEL